MNTVLLAAAPLIETLGWTLLHFLWQGLIVGAGFALARVVFAKHSCDVRYAIGLVALGLLAIFPALTFLALLNQQAADFAIAQTIATDAQGSSAAAVAVVASSIPAGVEAWLPWMVLAWICGVVLVALHALHQWRVLARIARDHAQSNPELESALANVANRFRFVRRIRVLVSEHIDTPTLIGWLKPVILLPTAVALGFPRQQVELILAHELGHLRRYDHVVNLAQALLETLFFYHPVVHWISNDVRNEREICCDALVLRVTNGERCEYARTLAALEELRHQTPARFALAASGGVLLDRIRRIVGMPATGLATVRPNFGMWVLAMAGLTVAFAAALKVDRNIDTLELSALSVDWLPARSLQTLPLLALGMQQHRPRVELATIAPSPAPSSTRIASASALEVAAKLPAAPALYAASASDRANQAPSPSAAAKASNTGEAAANALAIAPTPVVATQVQDARVSTVATAARPTAIRVVTPEYPRLVRGTGAERVEIGFAINPDGTVRDISVTNNGFDAAFGRAAIAALRKWRFDPLTVRGDQAVRYTQTFVFAQRSGASAADECVQSVGSHICRRPDDGR